MPTNEDRVPLRMTSRIIFAGIWLSTLVLTHCTRLEETPGEKLFTLVDPSHSGIDFTNKLTFSPEFNIYTYRNYYNGGGVAIGDINNDGLLDIYFTGNQVANKLYLNKGNFKFEDLTEKAGVQGTQTWSTGVAMADVNGDGLLDIYVCNSGNLEGGTKKNELFINNGDLTFREMAGAFGIADEGYTTHAAFFDYDNDGDLDLYILNNSFQAIGSFNLKKNERKNRDVLGGDKLMRNDNGHFTDVSEEAGIYGSVIGFGLGVTVGDVNKDQWLDIFVSNDFFERDYLYINNQNGTFKEVLTEQMKSISGASMGADLADINNDAWADLFVTEMLPKDNARLKTVTTFEDWNKYQYNVQNDYFHQFTRNMLQLNTGNDSFHEIGRLAGVEATDWSWGALMFDIDNDGLKDIFVANGIYQDLTNQDFLQFASNEEFVKSVLAKNSVDYKKLTDIIPSTPIPNFAFRNLGELTFSDHAFQWGLGAPGFSNGAAYGDLDNDGDLDLVVNNVNMPSFLYRNEATKLKPDNRYLKLDLKGSAKNTFAIGAKILAEKGDKKFYLEQMPMRGFESTVDHRPNLGLGNIHQLDRLTVTWPDGKVTVLDSVRTNQTLQLSQDEGMMVAARAKIPSTPAPLIFRDLKDPPIDFVHTENEFVDFDRDPLIYHMLSSEGPRMSKGDVNGDGLDDLYIGGAKDQPGALYIQRADGSFRRTNEKIFFDDRASEDMGSLFFDADNDGDQDLYVCSGGNELSPSSTALIDRLYINDGRGNFKRSPQLLPTGSVFESTSTVTAADYDGDGDQDLFVGVRLRSFSYGLPMKGYILNNDGQGNFRDVTKDVAPTLEKIGMITDASWADIDGDNDSDLIVVGEYMPVTVFINNAGKLADFTELAGLATTNGWWNRIEPADVDGDGDIDFVIGNHGLNSRFRASIDKPVQMYVNDFDQNGRIEHIICAFNGEKSYPMVLRHDLVTQIPMLKKKYLKYESLKDETITDIFAPEQLKEAVALKAYELRSAVAINDGTGRFSLSFLPIEAQFSPMFGLEAMDVDKDGKPDLLTGGNFYRVKPEVGRYDGSYGSVFRGDGKGNFTAIPASRSGVQIDGEVRDIVTLTTPQGTVVVFSRNNQAVKVYRLE